jgi:hypothetical protein
MGAEIEQAASSKDMENGMSTVNDANSTFNRRSFISKAMGAAIGTASALTLTSMGLAGCQQTAAEDINANSKSENESLAPLPPASPDPENQFGIDININMATIDSFLGRDNVLYRDVRMLFDPAQFDEIGGDSGLSYTLEGFRIIPFPYIGTLPPLPVEGRYDGDVLYVIEWNEDMGIRTAIPKYLQSSQILEEVFPKDVPLVLMCGGGGYASFMKKLLVFLGWDESNIYNIGGAWEYRGHNFVDLILYDDNKTPYYYFWRAMYTMVEFEQFTLLAGSAAESKNPSGLKKQSKHCQW